MPSTERWHPQQGLSLVEAVVAVALLGIGVVAGLTAWDTASRSAQAATHRAWAMCVGRVEMEAVLATSGPGYPAPVDRNVKITVSPGVTVAPGPLQTVTVTVNDPVSGSPIYSLSALKSTALSGAGSPDVGTISAAISRGCPSP
ncbi:MAG TPA: type II secretion system protein [Candidatus Dormibacteraeota bacterium]|nr:type II secretion system protein [Candidatus Dormibacteraeota bacterium]